MLRQVTIHQLDLFLEAAKLKNFSRAADKMAITQPAFSAQIMKLETILGMPLFERIGRRVELTQAGAVFEEYARRTIATLKEGKDVIDDMSRNVIGTLRIGASSTIANYVLPAYLGRFKKANPVCAIEMLVGNTNQVEEALLRNDIDMGLVEGPLQHKEVKVYLFKKDELVVIFSPSHRWSGKKKITIDQLRKEPLIIREKGSGTRKVFMDFANEANKPWNIAMELGNTEAIKKSAQANLGVAVLSASAVDHEIKDKSLHIARIEGYKFDRKLNVIMLENKYISNPLKSFIAIMKPAENPLKP
ncbi:Transcriptional regulator, LysR family [hydrothermal vent metagenome]|uniref:Transcriptional regulator, LysR family n=1 Tax=hydrothermal vent metagenome TaxID=652676 RepID=A0A3B1CDK2_9ZZZZ